MKSSVLAMSSTSGPIAIPSSSSTTTTGGARRRGTAATVTAARAAITTIAKKELGVDLDQGGVDPTAAAG